MVYWTNIYMEPNIAYVKFENQKHMHQKKNGNLALSFRILKRKKNKQDLPFFLDDIMLRNSVSSLVIVKPEGPTCAIF